MTTVDIIGLYPGAIFEWGERTKDLRGCRFQVVEGFVLPISISDPPFGFFSTDTTRAPDYKSVMIYSIKTVKVISVGGTLLDKYPNVKETLEAAIGKEIPFKLVYDQFAKRSMRFHASRWIVLPPEEDVEFSGMVINLDNDIIEDKTSKGIFIIDLTPDRNPKTRSKKIVTTKFAVESKLLNVDAISTIDYVVRFAGLIGQDPKEYIQTIKELEWVPAPLLSGIIDFYFQRRPNNIWLSKTKQLPSIVVFVAALALLVNTTPVNNKEYNRIMTGSEWILKTLYECHTKYHHRFWRVLACWSVVAQYKKNFFASPELVMELMTNMFQIAGTDVVGEFETQLIKSHSETKPSSTNITSDVIVSEFLNGYNVFLYLDDPVKTPSPDEYKLAQYKLWKAMEPRVIPSEAWNPVGHGTFNHQFDFNSGWFSSMVGVIEILLPSEKKCEVTLNVANILDTPTIIRTAEQESDDLTKDEKQEATRIFFDKFAIEGLKIKHVPPSLPTFKDHVIIRTSDGFNIYKIKSNGDRELRHEVKGNSLGITFNYPYLKPSKPFTYNSCVDLYTSESGVRINAFGLLESFLSSLKSTQMRRAVVLLNNHHTDIVFEKGAIFYPEDHAVFRICCVIAYLFPVALQRDGLKFRVVDGPIYWSIIDQCIKVGVPEHYEWKIGENRSPPLRPWQETAVASILRNQRPCDLVWLDPGAGKTLISITYILWCIANKRMTKYAIWSTSPEAIATLIMQLERAGLPYNKYSSRQTDYNPHILPGVINIIEHNHLRSLDMENVAGVISELTLVLDEFHMLMGGKSQRSAVAIELMIGSFKSISMSGTIFKDDSSAGDLTDYLEHTVDFYVTPRNYKVALGHIITNRVPSRSIIKNEVVRIGDGDVYDFMCIDAVKRIKEKNEGVFMVVKNKEIQAQVVKKLISMGVTAHGLEAGKPLSLGPEDHPGAFPGAIHPHLPNVIVTPQSYSAGYDMNRYTVMYNPVLPSNENTREQLRGRINRVNNDAKVIVYKTFVDLDSTGLFEHHQSIHSKAEALYDLREGDDDTRRQYDHTERDRIRREDEERRRRYEEDRKKREEEERKRSEEEKSNPGSNPPPPPRRAHMTREDAKFLLEIKETKLTQDILNKAYRKQMFKWHPDKWSSGTVEEKELALSRSKEMVNARDVLQQYL